MNKSRVIIVAFWLFVAVMLIREAYLYNQSVDAYTAANPEKHYFYDPGVAAPPPVKVPAADVRQIAYHVTPGSPSPGNFTVDFTIKNLGDLPAKAIQVKVRPYRGIINVDEDNGHAHGPKQLNPNARDQNSDLPGSVAPISDTDPLSQYGQWTDMPDLAPGQQATNSMTFSDQPGNIPNPNPRLEITFVPVKANESPKSPSAPAP